jgi:hypothetical protein
LTGYCTLAVYEEFSRIRIPAQSLAGYLAKPVTESNNTYVVFLYFSPSPSMTRVCLSLCEAQNDRKCLSLPCCYHFQSPVTMAAVTCSTSTVIEYSLLCLGNNPPDDCYPDKNLLSNTIWSAFLLLNIFFGLTGNLLTLVSVPYAKYRKKFGFSCTESTSLYILNLASCDFLFCAVAAPSFVLSVIYRGWPFGETMCAVAVIVRYGMTAIDWQALALIALSKCALLKWPGKGKAIFGRYSAVVVIGLSWLSVISFLLLLDWFLEV